jgi:hypothetical protein
VYDRLVILICGGLGVSALYGSSFGLFDSAFTAVLLLRDTVLSRLILMMAALSDDLRELDDITSGLRPRRHDDDDDGSDNDDLESTTSAPVAGNTEHQGHAEEEKELPPHACA